MVYLLQNLDHERFECRVLTIYDRLRHYEADVAALGIPIDSLHHGELRIVKRAEAVIRYWRLMWELRPHVVHGWLHYPNLIARVARPCCPPHRLITAIRSEYTPNQLRSEWVTSPLTDFRIVIREAEDHDKASSHTKTILIPNGIALNQFANASQSSFRETIFPNTPFLFLVPARIDPRKDHLTLIEALHRLSPPDDLRVVLIGEITDSNTQQQIQETIHHYHLDGIIEYNAATHEIAPFYHAADVVILPSKSEVFPNVVLEAFASHKPVIVSEAANRVGLVQHGINGWVFPTGDSAALAECLQTALATSPAERAALGQRGYDAVQAYTVERMVERYTQLYERVLNRES
ncbi:MAG TPA: glycosyltransferase [Phototrophicaceae bacterium]|nr:glycosyltransferase [Phototrophicaceae bacterium]